MAESMSRRRKAMAAAWEKARQNLGIWPPPPNYEDGFDAAWDALMAEIGPLIDRIYTVNLYERHATEGDRAHNAAVERLRELMREGK